MRFDVEVGQGAVAEIQGLYGPFVFPEKLLQQIWHRGDFDQTRAVTADDNPIRIMTPGRWNHLGGPDFKDARVQIGSTVMVGDIEVHLRESDWTAHAHAADSAYDNVVLHVVLFPTDKKATIGAAQRQIPLLALLPLLNHDLEEYAADEAIERLADHPLAHIQRELAAMPAEKLAAEFLRTVEARWYQKIHYAKIRIARLGWEAACHHTALEVLGYRFNRAPMLAVASSAPLADWTKAGKDVAETAYANFSDRWSKQGVRPANHPLARLRQYSRWASVRPEWPKQLLAFADSLPVFSLGEAVQTASVRRKHRWTALANQVRENVLGGEVGGTRFNTLVCDGLLPLLAARTDHGDHLVGVWYAWPTGDIPARYARLLRELGLVQKPHRPLCHGAAQGLIGWLLVADQRRGVVCPTPEGGGA
jgi:hypothetical protein